MPKPHQVSEVARDGELVGHKWQADKQTPSAVVLVKLAHVGVEICSGQRERGLGIVCDALQASWDWETHGVGRVSTKKYVVVALDLRHTVISRNQHHCNIVEVIKVTLELV